MTHGLPGHYSWFLWSGRILLVLGAIYPSGATVAFLVVGGHGLQRLPIFDMVFLSAPVLLFGVVAWKWPVNGSLFAMNLGLFFLPVPGEYDRSFVRMVQPGYIAYFLGGLLNFIGALKRRKQNAQIRTAGETRWLQWAGGIAVFLPVALAYATLFKVNWDREIMQAYMLLFFLPFISSMAWVSPLSGGIPVIAAAVVLSTVTVLSGSPNKWLFLAYWAIYLLGGFLRLKAGLLRQKPPDRR